MTQIGPQGQALAGAKPALLPRTELAAAPEGPTAMALDRFSPAQAASPLAATRKLHAERLLSGMPEGLETAVRSKVLIDRLDVTGPLSPTAKSALEREAQANLLAVEGVLTALGPEASARYRQLEGALKGHEAAWVGLQILALEGKLGPGPSGEATLARLVELQGAPLAEGLPRQALLEQAVLELAHPTAIAQKAPQTCVATSLQALLAMTQPEEYLRLLIGLASPGGSVRLANGDPLDREPGTEGAEGSKERSWPTQLLSPAFMEYANGDLSYDAPRDVHSDGSQGLSVPARQRLLEGLMNAKYESLEGRKVNFRPPDERFGNAGQHAVGGAQTQRPGLVKRIEEEMAKTQEPLSVALEWDADDEYGQRHGGHALLLLTLDADQATLMNPWGYVESLPRKDFENRLRSILIRQPT